jgi:phosphoribosylaminoimidazole carboxylase
VATVGINNSTNAAILAIRILGVGDPTKSEAIVEFLREEEELVMQKIAKLAEGGWENYTWKP